MDRSKENLRCGFTTGACATAASKGALLALIHQRAFAAVAIRLPQGQVATFPLHTCSYTSAEGRSSVIKDAGDDPDATDKAEVRVCVEWSNQPGVTFRRGPGVGLVTKRGLPVPPGEPAINPVPRRMIVETLQEIVAEAGQASRRSCGVTVEIAVPGGEEIAKKTYNPRLGIVGGISILGTTGIVTPYSTAAWLASVVQSIDVAVAEGCRRLVLTVGARGERTARQLFTLPDEAFIQIGPFFADALRHCLQAGAAEVSLASMIGKLAKFAAGNESVHSTASAQDFAFLARIARSAGASDDLLARIVAANTAQEVAEMILAGGPPAFFARLCEQAWSFARGIVGADLPLEVLLTGTAGEILGRYP
ncbi:MAG TPA: cobalt-precorrin-5B (C(1))-methyltransferase [Gemmataceae bacterium]|nr:cobalt-precorrin-5B (C(1))-methyltransferase [Gemmataceae bacterium]